jgi:hypothetical protein
VQHRYGGLSEMGDGLLDICANIIKISGILLLNSLTDAGLVFSQNPSSSGF